MTPGAISKVKERQPVIKNESTVFVDPFSSDEEGEATGHFNKQPTAHFSCTPRSTVESRGAKSVGTATTSEEVLQVEPMAVFVEEVAEFYLAYSKRIDPALVAA
jgi:hypothetical protein